MKEKKEDQQLSELEERLSKSKTPFLNGHEPSSEDRETFDKIQNKNLHGYPSVAGWYFTVSCFQADCRGSW